MARATCTGVMLVLVIAAVCWLPPRSAPAQNRAEQSPAEQSPQEQYAADQPVGQPVDQPADQSVDQPGQEDEGPYQYEDPEFGGAQVSYPMMVLRTIGIMGAVLIGLFLLYRLLIKKRNRIVTDSQVVNVLATYPLAANRTIQVVDIAGQVLVLGVSEVSINLITPIEDQETIDRIKLLSAQERGGQGGFKEQLVRLLGGGFSPPGKNSRPGRVSQLSGYRKRIERMRRM